MCTIRNFITLSPLFASVTSWGTREAFNKLHDSTSQRIHSQVQEGLTICRKHFYPETKDAAAAPFDGGMFVFYNVFQQIRKPSPENLPGRLAN